MTAFSWIVTGVAVAALVVIAVVVRHLAVRRQRAGADRLARTLHLNARWWKEQRAKGGELLYVAIGDSAAQGVGASQPGRSYVGLIARHLRERTGRSVRVVNLSISGARLREAIAVQLAPLRRLSPDVVTVAVGANDMPAFDRDRFTRELTEIFASLPVGSIVAEVPSFYLGSAERNVRVANAVVHRLAEEHGFPVAPLYARTRRQGAALYALNRVAADFFHPNDRGYRVWASAFLPLIDEIDLSTERDGADAGDGGLA
ncbi:SGNH/GDSL hydrolase family protein [Glaciihabitans sp. INWT7]|uniref:SGNH/GDSL hydrolase family protein n=1 Tax=Glaciihabitans sp. INWT7 TaxID=2596912 RepID=UPI0016284131|nr:SGNH/GDSL hydrolase family protein [Glaciihabitans sp. INWT7]QNE48011.1 SGNH/GDSL hydrolase family protein [Glaciihabitans sp. INWT7]